MDGTRAGRPGTPPNGAPQVGARSPRRRRAILASLTLVGLTLVAHAVQDGTAAGAATACTPWWGDTSLQSALVANVCTDIQPGGYTVHNYLVIPDGHMLQGNPDHPREDMVLRAGHPWNGNGYEAVINGTLPPHSGQSILRHFVVDGAGVSTGAAGVSDMIIDDMVVRGGRCWGIAIVGPRMSVTDSLIERNGADPSCPSPPGAGIYVAANQTAYGEYAPSIRRNEITANTGPGVDIYNVGRGVFLDNDVHGNSGWAAFSLFGSHWTVADNTITHPRTGGGQRWIPSCASGPSGPNPAAIFLCRDTVADGLTTASNTITGNTASSFYGILLIGNDEANHSAVPRNNTVAGNTVTGSVACADDGPPSGPTANTWVGCHPVHF